MDLRREKFKDLRPDPNVHRGRAELAHILTKGRP